VKQLYFSTEEGNGIFSLETAIDGANIFSGIATEEEGSVYPG
jgi:hypothetical protein